MAIDISGPGPVTRPATASTACRSGAYGRPFRLFHLWLSSLAAAAALFAAPVAAQAKTAPPEKLILALGDSLTAGYQLKPDQSFPAQLQAALRASGKPVRVHNAGVSGDTTAQGRARLPWVLNSLKRKPDLAIVALGANDMLRGQSPRQARANLDAILAEFDKRGIPVLLAGMLASPNLGQSYVREYNAIFPALAKKHDAALYPFFMQGVIPNRQLLLPDGLHPNPQGVKVMVRGILPMVQRELAKAPAKRAA